MKGFSLIELIIALGFLASLYVICKPHYKEQAAKLDQDKRECIKACYPKFCEYWRDDYFSCEEHSERIHREAKP